MQLREKTKTKKKKTWVVWDLSLENFHNRLLVWIEFKYVLNYCKIVQFERGKHGLCGI